jgi:hypothetical protein
MSHDHHHGGQHDHGPSHAEEEQGGPAPLAVSQRYELEDLFRGEAPENQHFLKVAGIVLVAVLLALALSYPLVFCVSQKTP